MSVFQLRKFKLNIYNVHSVKLNVIFRLDFIYEFVIMDHKVIVNLFADVEG